MRVLACDPPAEDLPDCPPDPPAELWEVAPAAICGNERVAADAAADAPNDFTIIPACTPDIAPRPQPLTIPDDTAADSTLGNSR